MIKEVRAKFLKGRRMEDNVCALSYCIKDSKKGRKELGWMGVDFK